MQANLAVTQLPARDLAAIRAGTISALDVDYGALHGTPQPILRLTTDGKFYGLSPQLAWIEIAGWLGVRSIVPGSPRSLLCVGRAPMPGPSQAFTTSKTGKRALTLSFGHYLYGGPIKKRTVAPGTYAYGLGARRLLSTLAPGVFDGRRGRPVTSTSNSWSVAYGGHSWTLAIETAAQEAVASRKLTTVLTPITGAQELGSSITWTMSAKPINGTHLGAQTALYSNGIGGFIYVAAKVWVYAWSQGIDIARQLFSFSEHDVGDLLFGRPWVPNYTREYGHARLGGHHWTGDQQAQMLLSSQIRQLYADNVVLARQRFSTQDRLLASSRVGSSRHGLIKLRPVIDASSAQFASLSHQWRADNLTHMVRMANQDPTYRIGAPYNYLYRQPGRRLEWYMSPLDIALQSTSRTVRSPMTANVPTRNERHYEGATPRVLDINLLVGTSTANLSPIRWNVIKYLGVNDWRWSCEWPQLRDQDIAVERLLVDHYTDSILQVGQASEVIRDHNGQGRITKITFFADNTSGVPLFQKEFTYVDNSSVAPATSLTTHYDVSGVMTAQYLETYMQLPDGSIISTSITQTYSMPRPFIEPYVGVDQPGTGNNQMAVNQMRVWTNLADPDTRSYLVARRDPTPDNPSGYYTVEMGAVLP